MDNNNFKLGTASRDKQTARVTIPRELIRIKAEQNNMSIQQFLDHFSVKWNFDNLEDIKIEFVQRGLKV